MLPDLEIITHEYQTCNDPDCAECTGLIECGIVMGCDGTDCGARGLTSSDGWTLCEDGAVLCWACAQDPDVILHGAPACVRVANPSSEGRAK